MRLLLLADYGRTPYRGSFVPMMGALLDAVEAKGGSGELLVRDYGHDPDWFAGFRGSGHHVRRIPGTPLGVTAHLRAAARAVRGDVVLHSHFSYYDFACLAAAASSRRARVFWHVHTILSRRRAAILRNVAKFALAGRRVDRIICVGYQVEHQLLRRAAPSRRVTVIPNGIDLGRFSRVTPGDRARARRQLDLAEGDLVVLHFARDWALKGGGSFLEAMCHLRTLKPNRIVGLSIGSGDVGVTEIERHGLSDVVRVLPAANRVEDLYAAGDVFLSTAAAEGGPLAVLEALASGLGVVELRRDRMRQDLPPLASYRCALPGGASIARDLVALLDRDPYQRSRDACEASRHVARTSGLREWAEQVLSIYEAAST